jgi:hypothetical protein
MNLESLPHNASDWITFKIECQSKTGLNRKQIKNMSSNLHPKKPKRDILK